MGLKDFVFGIVEFFLVLLAEVHLVLHAELLRWLDEGLVALFFVRSTPNYHCLLQNSLRRLLLWVLKLATCLPELDRLLTLIMVEFLFVRCNRNFG